MQLAAKEPAGRRRYEKRRRLQGVNGNRRGLARAGGESGVLLVAWDIGDGEIVARVETAIDAAGNLRGEGSARAFVVAGAGLSEILFAIRIIAAPGGAIHDRGQHSFTQIGKDRSDIKLLADARLEILALFVGARILQIKLFAAVGEGSHERSQLEGRDADAFA